ncbi:MAG: periplasmic heavy metal sensor [Burkholderiales bacterium]|nr:periplasmic heavy metal sensor [Burkholderiales bacterium]
MTRCALKLVLVCSLLANLGVLVAIGYRHFTRPVAPAADLMNRLDLSAEQRRLWVEAESRFLAALDGDRGALEAARERLVREMFSAAPDRGVIEAQRERIEAIQRKQQRLVIEQLLTEREMLDPRQRGVLADRLLQQPAGAQGAEQLHRR